MDNLDKLLQKNELKAKARESLTEDTLILISEIKSVKTIQKKLAFTFFVLVFIFITKWLSNDILFLINLAITKYTFVRSQMFLYFEALLESIPRFQFFAILFTSILWLGWKRFETFIQHTRITSKKTFAMKIMKMTPRLLIASILLVGTVLGFSGYTYAQKEEQKKLEILKEYVNATGRVELDTNYEEECKSSLGDYLQNRTNKFEIKQGSGLSAGDAQKILEANCLVRNARMFIKDKFSSGKQNSSSYEHMILGESKIIELSKNTITIEFSNVPEKIQIPSEEYTVTNNTKIYKNQILTSKESLKKGDIVIVIGEHGDRENTDKALISKEALGVYVLPEQPEFKWYNPMLIYSLTQIQHCEGNPDDRCSFTGSIDLFPSGAGEGNFFNPKFTPLEFPPTKNSPVIKEIAGSLIEINDKYVKIKSSSGRELTVNFQSNPIDYFNKNISQNHNNLKIELGDTIMVRYAEAHDEHSVIIENKQIMNAVFVIEVTLKYDSVEKY